jgi:DNA-binding CsgD family transcriptional regulator
MPVVGFEGLYEVSDLGRVRRDPRPLPRLMRPKVSRQTGYLEVSLYRDGEKTSLLVHRIIATAFLPPPPGQAVVNHRNGNRTDSRAINLEWLTTSANYWYQPVAVPAGNEAEIWRAVEGYAGRYECSNLGRVRSLLAPTRGQAGATLKPFIAHNGYLRVGLCKDGQCQRHPVHRLVALAFIGFPGQTQQINHKDGDKTNNTPANLEWTSASANRLHACRTLGRKGPRGAQVGTARLSEEEARIVHEMYSQGDSQQAIADKLSISQSAIGFVLRGRTWKHLGLKTRARPKGKLTEEQVREIKRLLAQGETLAAIAARYDIGFGTVSKIKLGTRWAHVV